ncbi:MAG: hypothetical protein DSZ12_06930 [Sulfurovum sp.]|nr:MAG: hypothetical protein DSZ12_06930 [Sulfurovum sp.]
MLIFTAYVFKGRKTAEKTLEALESGTDDYVWIDDVAVVSKDTLGKVRVHSTWAQDEMGASGLGLGALTSAILAYLVDPTKVLASAVAGGTLGGLTGLTMDEAFNDPRLDALGDELSKDSSALVLVLDDSAVAAYKAVMDPYNGKLIEVDVDDNDVAFIKERV